MLFPGLPWISNQDFNNYWTSFWTLEISYGFIIQRTRITNWERQSLLSNFKFNMRNRLVFLFSKQVSWLKVSIMVPSAPQHQSALYLSWLSWTYIVHEQLFRSLVRVVYYFIQSYATCFVEKTDQYVQLLLVFYNNTGLIMSRRR